MNIKNRSGIEKYIYLKASLTVEAALVLPVFLFFMISFLYFIQIFTIQEELQAAITDMGLGLAKVSYLYEDFVTPEDAKEFDQSVFDKEFNIGIHDLANAVRNGSILKFYVNQYLDTDKINRSCIQNGMEGIDFSVSKILDTDKCIDIIACYKVVTPFRLFGINDMKMIQRVKVRSWTGHQIAAKYSTEKEDNTDDPIVYITKTGSVYHNIRNCSYISLSIRAVVGIPTELRNDNGGKYYPCEYCCEGKGSGQIQYYITSDGTRYHCDRKCSKITRDVKEVHLSEVGDRRLCKRCQGK